MIAKFGVEDGWDMLHRGPFGCSPWRGILQLWQLLNVGLALKVRDRSCVKFWEDV